MKEVKVKKYTGSLLLKFALFCFACFFVFSLVQQQSQIAVKEKELDALNAEIASEEIKIEELQASLDTDLDMESYAEKVAREEYGYVLPQERIFINVGGQEDTE